MTAPLTDIALERSYVAMLLEPAGRAHIGTIDRLEPTDCALLEHGRILGTVYDMHARGAEIDAIAVLTELQAREAPRGALDALSKVHEAEVRLEPARTMAGRLKALARARRVREHLTRALADVDREHVEDALEHARVALGEELTAASSEIVQAGDVCRDAMASACEAATTKPRLRSGLARLDAAIKGFPPATLAVFGGDTGAGKSSLLLAIAMDMAEKQGARVGIVSVEDAPAVWGPRVLAHLVNVNSEQLEEGKITGELIDEANRGIELADQIGIFFRFEINQPIHNVIAAMRALVVEKRCSAIIVDYAQAITLAGEDRRVAMIGALQRLKGEAASLGVALLLASQLTRGDSDFREPTKRQLKEAGELENMADIIVLLWHTSDEEGAPVLGKVAKVKWSPRRPRFLLSRNPRGAVCGLEEAPATAKKQARPPRGFMGEQPNGWNHGND